MTELQELLDLPQRVKKSDFVVRLTEGVAHPDDLVRTYAVTPDLVDAFDRALGLVKSAIDDGQSKATYVHGSFGSGKSHFLGVLSLMLGAHEAPWRVPELHEVLTRHEWIKATDVLRLHFHMIGAHSVEQKVFSAYLDHVEEHHPDAPVAPLFSDQGLFENAEQLRGQLGDERFFAGLNEGAPEAGGWGAYAETWTPASFDAARASGDPDERARLFSALVKSHFSAYAQTRSGFVDFDAGLGVISRHAQTLGYDGVVLFLDELILWLASRSADRVWLSGEIPKVAKLVEAQDSRRPVPLVSLVARQRDITELVGDDFAGSEQVNLRDQLSFWEGRFDTLTLEDRNLPAIVEKRVVRARDEAAKDRLDTAFERFKTSARQSFATLLGDQGDLQGFRQVYPFTPALIEALVALSHYLQRERTALKVLMELLVEHLEDFSLGRVVCVGDLYDVLAGGEAPMDGAMRMRFSAAKRLYEHELLPLIQAEHGTTTPDVCQRLRDDHPVRIGCSNCPQARCRADNRLIKTLLLAALVPQVPIFKDLTVSRLVALNHGSLKAIIPGTEARDATARLRRYAADCGKLRVGEQDDPRGFIVLEGVDVAPVLEQAQGHNTPGARRRLLRDLLFEALGVSADQNPSKHTIDWRGTRRSGRILFGNVRTLDDRQLIAGDDDDFLVVVDYPFDEPGHSPLEDEDRLERYRDAGKPTWTLCWLPSFFSSRLQTDLADLVVLEAVLRDWRTYLSQFRPENQGHAKVELDSRASMKRERLLHGLAAAYGVATARSEELDPDRQLEQHFHVLMPGARVQGVPTANIGDALRSAIDQVLYERWPRHPDFDKITSGRLKKALERFEALCDAEGQRLPVDKHDKKDLEIAQELGFALVTEASASLRPHRFQDVDNALRAKGIDRPSARQVRHAFDPEGLMGLTRDVADFVVLCWAAVGDRELVLHGEPLVSSTGPSMGRLPDDVELVKPPMPTAEAWARAIALAGELFGLASGRALNARNLRALSEQLRERGGKAVRAGAGRVAEKLIARSRLFGERPPRLVTAESAADLLERLRHHEPVDLVGSLADYEPKTSAQAVARHLRDAEAVGQALDNELAFKVFGALQGRDDAAAKRLLDELRAALEADQVQTDLGPVVRKLALGAQELVEPPRRTPPPEPPRPPEPGRVVKERAVGRRVDELRGEVGEIERLLQEHPGAELEYSWVVKRGGE